MRSAVVARREIVGGLTLLGLAAVPSLRARPPAWEMDCFRAVNDLPDGWHVPVWPVMQLGALAAAPATAIAALAAGEPRLAKRLVVGGTAVWATAKVVKRMVVRSRPTAYATDARVRGPEAGGLGFPSGHAAVATALAGAAVMSIRPRLRPVVVAAAVTVAASRVYVGAHLPLDVVGGAALGLLIDGVLRLAGPKS
jgi:undecaprenyl-diphosphatase